MARKGKKDAEGPKDPKQMGSEELLAGAENILKAVDEAHIFRNATKRQFPSFERKELKYGPVLGLGGFSTVREIAKITLVSPPREQEDSLTEPFLDEHMDVSTAKRRMAKYYLRNGDARYAVKQLHPDLSEDELARGMIDLAIEARYLSVISHPNIIKMRGLAAGALLNKGFFLVLDRLYGTLEDKIREWARMKKSMNGIFLRLGRDKVGLENLMMERLLAAYDLAAAFRYLHEQRLVYRDIKSDNCGFDVRGDVKVFDFGLCKSLEQKLKVKGNLYKLTGCTGSFPYMAPEVALCKPYGLSADVFSFGILLWEIMALRPPLECMSRKEIFIIIAQQNKRPDVKQSWPALMKRLIVESWDMDPKKRPKFDRIAKMIRSELDLLTEDPTVQNRTSHMMDKSRRSFHVRGSMRNSVSSELHGSTSAEFKVTTKQLKAISLVADSDEEAA